MPTRQLRETAGAPEEYKRLRELMAAPETTVRVSARIDAPPVYREELALLAANSRSGSK
jgi:hypothetical protein